MTPAHQESHRESHRDTPVEMTATLRQVRQLMVDATLESLEEAALLLESVRTELQNAAESANRGNASAWLAVLHESRLAAAAADNGYRLASGHAQTILGPQGQYGNAAPWDADPLFTRWRAEA